ncbi:MAG: class I SAM-dependent methyltransferase [Gammaproteobacteria bacterium]|nr:class I SAM-dependent methyltransferase [Gammaproteobacteria bacterium]
MRREKSAHLDLGLKSILSKPQYYNIFSGLIGKKSNNIRFVQQYIKPFPGCKILDIGCGTSNILSYLPDSIGEYNGFDMNQSYIDYSMERWKEKNNCSFFCDRVSNASITKKGYYDIILAIGILHHLSDTEARDLLSIAHQALNNNGSLITYDNVYIDNQNRFAKWLISKDRGQAVRTVQGYKQLIGDQFSDIDEIILHDTLKVPYTIYLTRCSK